MPVPSAAGVTPGCGPSGFPPSRTVRSLSWPGLSCTGAFGWARAAGLSAGPLTGWTSDRVGRLPPGPPAAWADRLSWAACRRLAELGARPGTCIAGCGIRQLSGTLPGTPPAAPAATRPAEINAMTLGVNCRYRCSPTCAFIFPFVYLFAEGKAAAGGTQPHCPNTHD